MGRKGSPAEFRSPEAGDSAAYTLDLFSAPSSENCRYVQPGAANGEFRSERPRLPRQQNRPICTYFEDGSDGTRTRDLRRDRLVPLIGRLATIGALSLY
jgi:hypothetical protein